MEWFRGEDKLQQNVALKAIKYLIGVDDNCAMPAGHNLASFSIPLTWLLQKRIHELARRIDPNTLTKDNLDLETDYFKLVTLKDGSDDVIKVRSTVSGKDVKFNGIDMGLADDWVILDAFSYEAATLISVEAGIEQKIDRAYERQFSQPVYNTAFHFEADDEVPGCPRDCKSATASPMPQTPSSTSQDMTPLKINVAAA